MVAFCQLNSFESNIEALSTVDEVLGYLDVFQEDELLYPGIFAPDELEETERTDPQIDENDIHSLDRLEDSPNTSCFLLRLFQGMKK